MVLAGKCSVGCLQKPLQLVRWRPAHLPLHIRTLTPPHSLARMCSSSGMPSSFLSATGEARPSQRLGTLLGCAAQAPSNTFQPFHPTESSPWSPVWISVACGCNVLCQCHRTNCTSSTGGSDTPNFKSTSNRQRPLFPPLPNSQLRAGSLPPAHAQLWSDKPSNHIFLKELYVSCLKPSSLSARTGSGVLQPYLCLLPQTQHWLLASRNKGGEAATPRADLK